MFNFTKKNVKLVRKQNKKLTSIIFSNLFLTSFSNFFLSHNSLLIRLKVNFLWLVITRETVLETSPISQRFLKAFLLLDGVTSVNSIEKILQ